MGLIYADLEISNPVKEELTSDLKVPRESAKIAFGKILSLCVLQKRLSLNYGINICRFGNFKSCKRGINIRSESAPGISKNRFWQNFVFMCFTEKVIFELWD